MHITLNVSRATGYNYNKIEFCKECGAKAHANGYCLEHMYIYSRLHNEKMKIKRARPKFCGCGTRIFGKAIKCKECKKAEMIQKKGESAYLKKRYYDRKQEREYPEDDFDPKFDMTGIMANYNNLQSDSKYKVMSKQTIVLKKEDGKGYAAGIF